MLFFQDRLKISNLSVSGSNPDEITSLSQKVLAENLEAFVWQLNVKYLVVETG